MFIVLISVATMGTKQTIDSNWDDGYEVKIKYSVPTNPKSKLDLGSKGSSPRFGNCPALKKTKKSVSVFYYDKSLIGLLSQQ